jgi:hypothetical protein
MGENGALSIKGAGVAGKKWLTLANCLEINCDNIHLDTFSDNTLKYVQAQAIRYYVSTSRQGLKDAFMVKFRGENS